MALEVAAIESPAGPGSGMPFLASSDDGPWMSWLEDVGDGEHALRLANLGAAGWAPPLEVIRSANLFVNWADFPLVVPVVDGSLWAHWLERGEAGGYDYRIRVTRSTDGGASWSAATVLHDDLSPTEHGFVSAVALLGPDAVAGSARGSSVGDGADVAGASLGLSARSDLGRDVQPGGVPVGFAWLDGRKMATESSEPLQHPEMTLRYREILPSGRFGPEVLLDGRTCECCQTDAALTPNGPVVVYRDRTEDEVRDVHVVRRIEGKWTAPAPVHADRWHFGGCPVNGPALSLSGGAMAVAWFTAANDTPRVKIALSGDHGASFGAPIQVDAGDPLGRVDLVGLGDGSFVTLWLERVAGGEAEVRARIIGSVGDLGPVATIARTGQGRASGFPRAGLDLDGSVVVAWTDVGQGGARVRVSRLTPSGTGGGSGTRPNHYAN